VALDVCADVVEVSLDVENVGGRDGADVVQVYVSPQSSHVSRPPRELKGFVKADLRAGEKRRVDITVLRRDLAYWDDRTHGWVVEEGEYRFDIGASSRDIRLTASVWIAGEAPQVEVTMESSITEVLRSEAAAAALRALFAANGDTGALRLFSDPEPMVGSFPLGRIASFQEVTTSREEIAAAIDALEAAAPRLP